MGGPTLPQGLCQPWPLLLDMVFQNSGLEGLLPQHPVGSLGKAFTAPATGYQLSAFWTSQSWPPLITAPPYRLPLSQLHAELSSGLSTQVHWGPSSAHGWLQEWVLGYTLSHSSALDLGQSPHSPNLHCLSLPPGIPPTLEILISIF